MENNKGKKTMRGVNNAYGEKEEVVVPVRDSGSEVRRR